MSTTDDADVVVVGAGLAGLTAGYALRTTGHRVLVLEAGERPGGRVLAHHGDVVSGELGAEWLGPRHRNLLRLGRDMGMSPERAKLLGAPIRWRPRDQVSTLPPGKLKIRFAKAFWYLKRDAALVDPYRPWEGRGARYDATSFAEWLTGRGVPTEVRQYLGTLVHLLSSTRPEDLSLLHVLWWVRRAGGPVAALDTTFRWRFREGNHELTRRLAACLGDSLRFGSRARTVHTGPGGATVSVDRQRFSCAAVVVTGCPGSPGFPAFDPPLPERLRQLSALQLGPEVKVHAALPNGPLPEYRISIGGRVIGGAWRAGRRVAGVSTIPSATDEELLADLAEAFEVPRERLRDPAVQRWGEHPWIGGCDLGFRPGQLIAHGQALAEQHEPVWFAGAERSSWPNNMEGAVESGLRAAAATRRYLG